MKKIILTILTLILSLTTLVSCGDSSSSTNDPSGPNNPVENGTYYTVDFNGTTLSSKQVVEGGKLSKPAAPEKDGYVFAGWYLDASYEELASFPLTINADTTLYGKYNSLTTAFIDARKNTIGSNVDSYEYDYTINASASALSKSFTGTTTGNSKYNRNSTVSFYDVHENSGVLFYEGSKYQIKKGNQLQSISLDENGNMTNFESKQVDDTYKCDFGSFAKALFTYSDSDIESVEKTDVNGKYKLNAKTGASDVVALIGNNLNNPIVEHLIGSLPETDVKTNMYVTFNDDKLATYIYEININVSAVKLSLEYILTFKNINKVSEIVTKEFDNVAMTSDTINAQKQIVYGYLNDFISQTSSGYNFELNTGVDHGYTSLEINSTFQGSAYRNIKNNKTYFHNHIEIDSDYKNDDVYKNIGIKDIEIKKTMLSNGDVYLIEKKLFSDEVNQVSNYASNDNDSYFLYNSYLEIEDITFVQSTVDNKTTKYLLGVSQEGVVSLLNWFNLNLDLDPLDNATSDVKIFGDFDEDSVIVDEILFEVTVVDGELSKIRIVCQGQYETALTGSKDFSELKEAVFDFDLTIKVDSEGTDFTPYTSANDAK